MYKSYELNKKFLEEVGGLIYGWFRQVVMII